MSRRIVICLLLTVFLLTDADAQQATKVPRIGFLSITSPSSLASPTEAFRQGLREAGYIEGQNITIEYRYADGKFDRLPFLAAELVRLKVDVIVTPGNSATRNAKQATTTIPIVMMLVQQPVSSGLVGSLARPGANVTGLTTDVTPEQAGKNLELLKEVAPKVSHVAILRRTNVSTHMAYSKEAERAAKILGITVQFAEVQGNNDKHLEEALTAIVHEHAGALLIPPSGFFASRRRQIVDFATRNNLPAIYHVDIYVENGGLMSYGPNIQDLWRRAATYVDKILKGTKPADLPVEQPTKFELVINLKTAKQIGLTIPPNVLVRADRVIR
jgi:putative ABC transport system substrate-binding protein